MRAILWLLLILSTAFPPAFGCRREARNAAEVQTELTFSPSPPQVGPSAVQLRLADVDGAPLTGARVRLEGNMNHAGMIPSFADLTESQPGQYVGTLEFTMGGDWFILVTAVAANGRHLEHKIDVPGVRIP